MGAEIEIGQGAEMGLKGTFSTTTKNTLAYLLEFTPSFLRGHAKYFVEKLFWLKTLKQSNNEFYNGHMEDVFTKVFDTDKSFYEGKRMLDVGCGPVGSLEWADNAAERVGVDPLANAYVKMNKGVHEMTYVQASAEAMPFPDASFDVVSVFNALDHVDDVDAAVQEIRRVVAPGGALLLVVELNHKPTVTEPHQIDRGILDTFGFAVEFEATYALGDDHNIYGALFNAVAQTDPSAPAVMCVRMKA